MIVASDVLGPVAVPDGEILRFPTGLLGLPDCRAFALIPADREGLYWLQSVERSELAFVLVDPFLHFEGYAVDLTPADLAELRAESGGEVAVLTIVTLPEARDRQPTTNLQGPLALNLRAAVGKQLVIQDPGLGVRAPFDLVGSKAG